MNRRSPLTATLLLSITATLGAAACDRALPIGSIPGDFHPHPDSGGSGGSSGSGGSPGLDGGTAGGLQALEVAPGWYHICARLTDASVRCWGDNQLGELGASAVASGAKNVVAGITNASSILADYVYS